MRAELNIPDDAVVAIHVARVDVMKDHPTFLAAMTNVPDVTGVLVGLGTEKLTLPPNVRALGVRQDIARLYTAADLVVSSSAFGEGFSNILAEGMSSGLIPIATDVGNARVIVGDAGRIVARRDSIGLSSAIATEARASCEARAIRGAAARQRILMQYTIERSIDAYARIYAER